MTPLGYTDPATARRYVDAVTSLSDLGMARFGRPLVLTNYTDVRPTLTSLDAVEGALDEVAGVVAALVGHPRAYM